MPKLVSNTGLPSPKKLDQLGQDHSRNSSMWQNSARADQKAPQQTAIAMDLSSRIPRIVKTPAKLRREIQQMNTSQIMKRHIENTIMNNVSRTDKKMQPRSFSMTQVQ